MPTPAVDVKPQALSMSNLASSPASFLNLDLELECPVSLAPLARHFGNRVMVLHCGPGANGEHLSVEPLVGGQLNPDPAACTEHMLDLLEGLPVGLYERAS